MKTIDLEDENTLPKELFALLKSRAPQLKDERDNDLKFSDLRWLSPIETPITKRTIEEILHIITPLEIRAYHCTRLLNPKKILTTGLRLLTPEMHKEILAEAMEAAKCTLVETEIAFKLLSDFQGKNYYKNREQMIWFILSQTMARYRDCEVFFKQVGGEVTERALRGAGDTILSKLSSVGVPILIECTLPISDAEDFQIDDLAKNFIRYGIEKFVEKKGFYFYCEMFVKHEIPKETIQSIWELPSLL